MFNKTNIFLAQIKERKINNDSNRIDSKTSKHVKSSSYDAIRVVIDEDGKEPTKSCLKGDQNTNTKPYVSIGL